MSDVKSYVFKKINNSSLSQKICVFINNTKSLYLCKLGMSVKHLAYFGDWKNLESHERVIENMQHQKGIRIDDRVPR